MIPGEKEIQTIAKSKCCLSVNIYNFPETLVLMAILVGIVFPVNKFAHS